MASTETRILSREVEQERDYWIQRLSRQIEPSGLPKDYERSLTHGSEIGKVEFTLDGELLGRLEKLTGESPFLLYTTLLASVMICLHKYTGNTTVIVGSPARLKSGAAVPSPNALPIIADIDGLLTFRQLLFNLREVLLAGYSKQSYPFERLIQDLGLENQESCPIFSTIVTLRGIHTGIPKLKNEISVIFEKQEGGLHGTIEYEKGLFARSRVERFATHLVQLLQSALADSSTQVGDLRMLPEAELHAMLQEWNDTEEEYEHGSCVHDLFWRQTESFPDAVSVVFLDRHITYRQLDMSANQLAHHLLSLGAAPELLVGICLQPSIETVIAILAVLKSGSAYVPLDPQYPTHRLAAMVEDAGISLLILNRQIKSKPGDQLATPVCLDSDQAFIERHITRPPWSAVMPQNLAYVIYTSGSTGKPKGTMITHQGVCNLVKAQSEVFRVTRTSRVLQFASLSFDASVSEIFVTLAAGAVLHLGRGERLMSGQSMVEMLRQEAITCVTLPPALLATLEEESLDSLEVIVSAGEACGREVAESWGRGRKFINAYGPTEVTVCATAWEMRNKEERVPIGRPIINTRVYAMGEEGEVKGIGVAGEMFIWGDGLGRGYTGRADLTAERFVPCELVGKAGARAYRTGDVVRYRADGELEFVGRKDHQIKLRGYRIEPREIEIALEGFPGINKAAVILDERASDNRRLIAFVASEELNATALAVDEVRAHLRARLPEFMLPSDFVITEQLPLSANGKVDRRALKLPGEQLWVMAEYVAPQNQVQEILAGIWSELLETERVGINDNFFDLGGHSLLATQVFSRIRDAFKLELQVRELFEGPTIAQLARKVEASMVTGYGLQAPPIVRAPRDGDLPLSFAQQRLWFFDQLEPGSTLYNIAIPVRLEGVLNLPAFKQTLNEIVRRHEVLRTVIHTVNGRPVQHVKPPEPVPVPIIDLRQQSAKSCHIEALRLAREEAGRPFDMARGPLLRIALLQLGEQDHVLIVNMHHIVSDAWSMGIVFRELTELYESFLTGKASQLAELPIQYADFAYWQRGWLQGAVLDKQLNYWRRQLGGSLRMLELPTDKPRPAVQSFRGAKEPFGLSEEFSDEVRELARQEKLTLFILLLTAFKLFLLRYTGQTDIAVGTPIANRNRAETEGVIGFFINTLVLRTDLSGNPTFRELLKRVREVSLEAYAYQDVPFEKIVDELQPERDLSLQPLFQVMFILQNAPMGVLKLGSLRLGQINVENETTQFDLTISVGEHGRFIGGMLNYNSDIFDRHRAIQMNRYFCRLLNNVIADPDQRLWEVELLSEAERHQISCEWNDTDSLSSHDLCIHELFQLQALASPDSAGVVFKDHVISYSQLNRRANQLAHFLRLHQVGPESLVGICLDPSPEMIIAILGVLKAGSGYVPLDPEYPRQRLLSMASDSEIALLLCNQHWESLEGIDCEVIRLDRDWQQIAAFGDSDPQPLALPSNVAYVIYTSGSTGKPKGVMIEHRSVVSYVTTIIDELKLNARDRMLQFASISFDTSVEEIFSTLSSGATLVLRSEGMVDTVGEFMSRCRDNGVSVIIPPTAYFHEVSDSVSRGEASVYEGLRMIYFGGEKVDKRRVRRWMEGVGSRTKLKNGYGPTETTVVAAVTNMDRRRGENREEAEIGRAIRDVKVYVENEEGGLVGMGIVGEIRIGGKGVARGYKGGAWQTAERFVPDERSGEAGVRKYRTGDKGRYLADGEMEYVGRGDDQVKVRGYRIELGEIEAVLREHSGVKNVVVEAREWKEAEKRLVGYVVLEDEMTWDNEEVKEYLRERLPKYMVPDSYVVLKELPVTSSGKVDRRALPPPDYSSSEYDMGFVAPSNRIEAVLSEIWAKVLGIEKVGIYDNFFALGGDSILSIQVIARANQAGLSVTAKQLFLSQTISELAKVVRISEGVKSEQGVITGQVPLTPIQQWFFERNYAGPHHYNQSLLLELREPIFEEAFEGALLKLVEHHDALRLRFVETEQGWQQSIAGMPDHFPLQKIDLSAIPESKLSKAIVSAAEAAQANMDMEGGLLLKVVLFDLGATQPGRLMLALHHLAVDGVSWRILLEDLQYLYDQESRGEKAALPPKTTSFKEWATRLEAYGKEAALQQELNYWLTKSHRQVRALPVDFPGGVNIAASMREIVVGLDKDETKMLLQDVPPVYRTQINDVLLTALARVMSEWTQAKAVMIDMEGHGREELFEDADVSRTVGWFTSVYPIVLELEATDDTSTALKKTKEKLRQIPNKGVGHGILKYLGPQDAQRSLKGLPEAEVEFNYLGQFDQTVATASMFGPAKESAGRGQSAWNDRDYLLEISSSVVGGRLFVGWGYSQSIHAAATIEKLAQRYVAVLREIIAHCQSPEAGGYTPSDFDLANLEQTTLDLLVGSNRNVVDIYPLSPAQEGMLFHSLYNPESGAYFEQMSCTLYGKLNPSAFEKAWQRAIDQHTILRTAFYWERLDQSLQVVYGRVELPWTYQDWQDKSLTEQRSNLKTFLQDDRHKGFDLSQAPLMRLALFRMGEYAYQLVWSHHHMLLDGWSMPLLLKDVFGLYAAFCRGKEYSTRPGRPYRDYIEWLSRQDMSKAEEYWRAELSGFSSVTRLTVDREPEDLRLSGGLGVQDRFLSSDTTEALTAFAKEHQLTLNTVVQGAWALLLSRYSNQSDVVYGTAVSGRPPDLEGSDSMIGMFINTLPVRVRVGRESRLLTWLQQLQVRLAEARQYEYSPLMEVQRWSEVPPGQPLFETIVVFENYPVDPSLEKQTRREAVLAISNVHSVARTNYPITLLVSQGQHMALQLQYDTARFDGETIGRMMAHLQNLIEHMVSGPNRRLDEVTPLSQPEQHQMVLEWNDTYVAYRRDTCIHRLFEQQVERTPDMVAAIFNQQQITYKDLNRRANQLAHHLRSVGVLPEARVAICMQRSIEMIIALLGVLKAGAAYVPMDPEYPGERLNYMLEDGGVAVLLTQGRLVESLPEHSVQVVCVDEDWQEMASQSMDNLPVLVSSNNLAYVIYTSGSTGVPKGVLGLHGAALNRFKWMWNTYPFEPGETCCQKTSLSFVDSVWEVFGPLLKGVRTVIIPDYDVKDTRQLLDVLSVNKVTRLVLVPSLLKALLDSCDDLRSRLPELKVWITSGEALPLALLERFQKSTPEAVLLNLYGSSEVSADVTWYDTTVDRASSRATIGRPLSNTEIYLLDRHLQPVPVGVAGEIYVGGAGLARGYINKPDLTAEKFVGNAFSQEEGGSSLYSTGDLARYREDGRIEYLGRIDHQVKVRGYRIELGEIEEALREHISVKDAAVVVRDDEAGDKRLVAYVVSRSDQFDVLEVRNYLKQRLPAYMVPDGYVLMNELPLTPSGKIDRKALPLAETARLSGSTPSLVQPRDALELQLQQIWQSLFKINEVGITDNFFDLGGNSLSAMRLISRIEKETGQLLPLSSLFEGGTIEHLATQLRQGGSNLRRSPLVGIQTGGSGQPFFCVHPAGGRVLCYVTLARLMGADQPFYGLQSPGLDGETTPYENVEEMAASYVAEIRKVQPEGPYMIGGWSLGGAIAYEVAQQLLEQGQEVAMLAIIDFGIAEQDIRPAEPGEDEDIGENMLIHLLDDYKLAPEVRQLPPDQQLAYLVKRAKELKRLPPDFEIEHAMRYLQVYKANVVACDRYLRKMRSYPNGIVFFRATDDDDTPDDPAKGWNRFAQGGVEVYDVPGTHLSIVLEEQNAGVLAEQLSLCISQAKSRRSEEPVREAY